MLGKSSNANNWNQMKSHLRWTLILISLGLAIPIVILVDRTIEQVKKETFYNYVSFAEDMTAQLDERIYEILQREEERPFEEYSFLNVAGSEDSNFLQLSPLSRVNPRTSVPGVVGYFQIDPDGSFRSPLLPYMKVPYEAVKQYGISETEFEVRVKRQERIRRLLTDNRLIATQVPEQDEKLARHFYEEQMLLPTLNSQKSMSTGPRKTYYKNEAFVGEGASRLKLTQESITLEGDHFEATAHVTHATTDPEPAATVTPPTPLPSQSPHHSLQASVDDPSESEEGPKSWGKKISDMKLDGSLAPDIAGQQTEGTPLEKDVASSLFRKRQAKKKERSKRKVMVTIPDQHFPYSNSRATVQALKGSSLNQSDAPRGNVSSRDRRDKGSVQVSSFEGEIDPLQFELLDSGEIVFFRKVWRNKQRFIQGFLLDRERFLRGAFQSVFVNSKLFEVGNLLVAYKGHLVKRFYDASGRLRSGREESPKLFRLFSSFLSPPLNHVELIYTIGKLPASPSQSIVYLLVAIIAGVMIFGLVGIYRLGVKQIDLARQRGDFVSAISHELKTPLTSIRMYGEMLRSGWVQDPEKQSKYYDFIFFESERLSRLISNVLQLSRLSTQSVPLELKPAYPGDLLERIKGKVETQIESAGFERNYFADWPESFGEKEKHQTSILVDEDSFIQIIINLVDNALKFSSKAELRRVEIGFRARSKEVIFVVRDFGPGISKDQRKKIFELFYRAENEMTRTTSGTGIGLALVRQLSDQMNAKVDLGVPEKGAEFQVRFPISAPKKV